MKIQAPKGTYDILPGATPAWRMLEKKFHEVCRSFNFQEIRLPTFEQTELFQRGVGDSSDIVQKEMYTFIDKGGRSMTLRPEATAGVVRAFLEHGLGSEPSPQKLYYIMNNFRYEKMGKGRNREFHQMGCELFSSAEADADAELISLLNIFFKQLGLHDIKLKLNSIGCAKCRPDYFTVLKDYFKDKLGCLCQNCQDRFDRNPFRILDCKEDCELDIIKEAPLQKDYLCPDCQEHFNRLQQALDNLGISYEVDGHIVRGLDYYTRTVFEFVSENIGSQGTICGGGRYDGLVEELGGQKTPAVGFALGVERLLLELESQEISLAQRTGPDLYILAFSETADRAEKVAYDLRSKGFCVEYDLMKRSFKAQMKYANRVEAKYLLVLGQDELVSGQLRLKNMADGSEQIVDLEKLGTKIVV